MNNLFAIRNPKVSDQAELKPDSKPPNSASTQVSEEEKSVKNDVVPVANVSSTANLVESPRNLNCRVRLYIWIFFCYLILIWIFFLSAKFIYDVDWFDSKNCKCKLRVRYQ